MHKSSTALSCLAFASFLSGCSLAHDYDALSDGVRLQGDAAATRDATSDGTVDAPRDGTRDAANDADGGNTQGFCAIFKPEAGVTAICEDFDESSSVPTSGATNTFPGGSLVIENTVSKSPPNAMQVSAAVDGGSTEAYLQLSAGSSGAATTYTLDCDVLLPVVPAGLGDQLYGFWFLPTNGDGSFLTVHVALGTTPNELDLKVVEESPQTYLTHSAAASVSAGAWVHLTLVLSKTSGGFVDTFMVNGTASETNHSLAANFSDDNPQAEVGWNLVSGNADVTAYFDNVVVTWN